MFFLFNKRSQPYQRGPSGFGSSFLMLGLLSIFFGLAIISAPELLAYMVAGFFIIAGIWMLMFWWNLRKLR
jgi:uncharacterized membrane protein HdeD (DUF308 family)